MENASQALFIAAGVLLAVLIITFGIFLFSSASSVSENYDRIMSQTEMQKFNAQFTKFQTNTEFSPDGIDSDEYGYIKYNNYNKATDVISAVNLAYSLNQDYDHDIQVGIQVKIKTEDGIWGITPKIQRKFYEEALRNNTIWADDKGIIYQINDVSKQNQDDDSLPNNNKRMNNNAFLEKYLNDCKIYKGKNKIYKLYKYYFEGKVSLNEDTGLVDEVDFILNENSDFDYINEVE